MSSSLPNMESEELRARMDKQDTIVQSIRNDQSLQMGALQRVETQLAQILNTLGKEEEDGKGGYLGTGIIGRTRRNERSVIRIEQQYVRWKVYAAGFASAALIGLGSLWWLISDKLALVLKAH